MYRLILLVLLAPSLVFSAGPIYKSIDDKGNVTYSAEPPAAGVRSEPIAVSPPPSAQEVQLAEEEARKVKVRADKLEAERKGREAEQAAAAAAASPTSSTGVIPRPGPYGDEILAPTPRLPVPVPLPAREPIRR